MNERTVARFLGWFSLGLGAVQIAAPGAFTRAFYTRNRTGLVRTAYGLREIVVGVGILALRNPAPLLWSRVAGDVFDLGTLGVAYDGEKPARKRRNIALAAASVLGVLALDAWSARRLSGG